MRYSLPIGYAIMPPIIPQTQRFAQKSTPEICAKKLPRFPLKGKQGTDFGLLTAQKIAAIIRSFDFDIGDFLLKTAHSLCSAYLGGLRL